MAESAEDRLRSLVDRRTVLQLELSQLQTKIDVLTPSNNTGQTRAASAGRHVKTSEKKVQAAVEKRLHCHERPRCPAGIPDIVTDTLLLEIKHWQLWKAAIGQIQAYARHFRDRRRVISFLRSQTQGGGREKKFERP